MVWFYQLTVNAKTTKKTDQGCKYVIYVASAWFYLTNNQHLSEWLKTEVCQGGPPSPVIHYHSPQRIAYLYVCIFVYLYICIFVYLYICIFVYLHICIIVYLYICIFVYLYIFIFVYFVYLHICIFFYLHICIFMHLCICIFVYSYTRSLVVEAAIHVHWCGWEYAPVCAGGEGTPSGGPGPVYRSILVLRQRGKGGGGGEWRIEGTKSPSTNPPPHPAYICEMR